MESRGRRDEMVIATKYCAPWQLHGDKLNKILTNFGGSGSKNLRLSVEASLKNLRTDYIDLYYVHNWDMTTSAPELMLALNTLITTRKVLYLGISDSPAWVNTAAERDLERDIIPMCLDQGMGIQPYGVPGGGYFKAKANTEKDGGRNMPGYKSKAAEAVTGVLENVKEKRGLGMGITGVALAYVLHKSAWMLPIVGGRNVGHLRGCVEALEVGLEDEDVREIEAAYEFDLGFLGNFLGGTTPETCGINKGVGVIDYVEWEANCPGEGVRWVREEAGKR
ncbi:MAG: hypothetical protein Q9176_004066 [Flavoplaca citrina]